eukprot:5311884-Prymnesium_polylepis.1
MPVQQGGAANAWVLPAELLRQVLAHPGLSSIGDFSFAVYLLQWFWFYVWYALQACELPGVSGLGSAALCCFLATLWLSAGLWTTRFEAPLAHAIKAGYFPNIRRLVVLAYAVGAACASGTLLSTHHVSRMACGGSDYVGANSTNATVPNFWPLRRLSSIIDDVTLPQVPVLFPYATLYSTAISSPSAGLDECDDWDDELSIPAAEAMFGGRFYPASVASSNITMSGGRWMDVPGSASGAMTDYVSALASVRVLGASNVSFAVHATCGRTSSLIKMLNDSLPGNLSRYNGVKCRGETQYKEL